MTMRRREFITLLGGAAMAWPLVAQAQQQTVKTARIGFFRAAGPHNKQFQAFRDGMQALGYVEGRNLSIEQRYAAGVYERLNEYAAELARLNLDVIVVDGAATAKAAKAATAETPVVFALAADPVADGLVASMSRPGANLTGLTLTVGYQLAGKRVELLKELVPALARVAVLGNSDNPPTQPFLREAERVGVLLGLTVRGFDARHINDLGHAFDAMADWRADGVTTLNDGMFFAADVSWRWRKNPPPRGRIRGSWRPSLVRPKPSRSLPARRPLRGQNSQRSETGRIAGRAAQQVGACSQSHDGTTARANDQPRVFVARRRGD